MSVRTIIVCDVAGCGAEQEIKGWSGPMDGARFALELSYINWWQRNDMEREVCPKHPRPVDTVPG